MSREVDDVMARFLEELAKPSGDGKQKRARGDKPPWYNDTHEAQIFSHIAMWKRGELVDPDSGAHPLVHAAWRCLAIACIETGNVPQEGDDLNLLDKVGPVTPGEVYLAAQLYPEVLADDYNYLRTRVAELTDRKGSPWLHSEGDPQDGGF